jgi:hypothetical protein
MRSKQVIYPERALQYFGYEVQTINIHKPQGKNFQ